MEGETGMPAEKAPSFSLKSKKTQHNCYSGTLWLCCLFGHVDKNYKRSPLKILPEIGNVLLRLRASPPQIFDSCIAQEE